MNPFLPGTSFASQMQSTQRRESSNRRPPKKVLNILDNFCPKSEDLTTTLFLGDLSVICDEIKLYELFSRFGGVETVQLKKSDRDPQRAHLGFGFIKFSTRESAERALQEMNGYFFLGRAMRVGWAVDYGKQQTPSSMEKASDPKKNQTAQIHVMFVTRELNRRVSELDLGGVFSRYGNLVDIAIKKNAINNEHGVQSGYAFLHFALTPEGLKSAVTAVEEVNNLVVDNIAYQCKVTHTLQAQFLSMNYSEEESAVGMANFPRPLSHVLPSSAPLGDSNFKSYDSPSQRMNLPRPFEMDILAQQNTPPSVTYGRGFHSSGMDPTMMMMGRTEQSLSPLPPSLDHHLNPFETQTNTFPPSFQKISNDRVMNSFTRQHSPVDITPNLTVNTHQSSTTAQHYLYPSHDHYHREQPVAGSLSLSSSFVSSVNEDPLRRRNNNNNMMTHPYDKYYQPQNHHPTSNNNYDDVSRF